MKRQVLAGLLIAVLFTSVAANVFAGGTSQAGQSPASGVITIEFFQQKMEEGPQRAYQAVIDRFHQEYPNYRIQMNTVPDAGTVLTSRVVSGDIPPLFSDYPTQLQFKEKVRNGIPLDISNEPFMQRVNKPAVEMSLAPDGKSYAMPLSHNFMAVYYNIDIFNANGISVPTTYAEFIAACQKLKAANILPLVCSFMDRGRAGHTYQAMNAAWAPDGVQRMVAVMNSTGSVKGDPVILKVAERTLEVVSYANTDTFAIPDTEMWNTFANGKAAMCITGSYARGTIFMANPNINMGAFPIPNDTAATTPVLTGIDAALCVSASATPDQKKVALAFLEFLSRPENAQIFCDIDGAPSAISGVVYSDARIAPVTTKMQAGPVRDWFATFFPGNIQNSIYDELQQMLMDKNAVAFLDRLDNTIRMGAQ